LGKYNVLVKKKPLPNTKGLHRLFNSNLEIEKSLNRNRGGNWNNKYIRFEERVLFLEIQKVATETQLQFIMVIKTKPTFLDSTTE